jgi:Cu2+-exporting ATPase
MAILVASGNAASRGILFRGGDVIERTSAIDTVAFDKTGTLTLGRPQLVAIHPAAGVATQELLCYAAQAAVSSTHPLATGIARALAESNAEILPPPRPARVVPGRGIVLDLPQGTLRMGNRSFLCEAGISVPEESGDVLTEVHLALSERYLGNLLLDDPLRPEAEEAISLLRTLRLKTRMLTGDRIVTARRIATRIGLDAVSSELTPSEKASWVRKHEEQGGRVLMVGDGINDAPALSTATVGCAMAGGTDIALESSELVLTKPSLTRVVEAIRIARRCVRIVRENLFWAFFYNLLALPLAATGHLAPIHAAAAMALSSLCVVANSLRLSRNPSSFRC